MIKTFDKLEIEEKFLSLLESIYKNPPLTPHPMVKKWTAECPILGTRQGCSLPTYTQHGTRNSSQGS